MPNKKSKESKLVDKFKGLDFIRNVEISSITNINSRNFENTLVYNKNLKKYIANINFSGHDYKISISVEGNRPNPKYERKLRKLIRQ